MSQAQYDFFAPPQELAKAPQNATVSHSSGRVGESESPASFPRARGNYEWTTPRGDRIPLEGSDVQAFADIASVFPGARCTHYRVPGDGWVRA